MVLRHQLLALLEHRHLWANEQCNLPGNCSQPVHDHPRLVPFNDTPETRHAMYQTMVTYFHTSCFYNRASASLPEKVDELEITPSDEACYLDIRPYMNLAPLTVQSNCAVWRAFKYFRTMGLRHLPVTSDDTGALVGILSRQEFMHGH
eukprot:gene3390-4266_t